jgi:2-polyprenyl-3-methyl-5-hydroxy-6-metoxy-1,4-benzoquinol methylase
LKDILEAEQKFPNTTIDARRMIKRADLINLSGYKIALDVGSGYGFCTKELRDRGYHTISINPGKFENEVFKQLNGEYPIVGMVQDVKLDNKFGIIVLSQVLEHIPKPANIIHYLSSLLEIGGVLVCAVPNFNSFSVKLRGIKDEGCLWIPEHVNYMTIEGLRRMFGASNLQIIESSFLTRIPYNAVSKRLILSGYMAHCSETLIKYTQRPFALMLDKMGYGIVINACARKTV